MKKIKEVRNDTLNASIIMQEYVEVDGVEYYSDAIEVKMYHNSAEDRERLKEEQPEAIANGILEVWGDIPTVIEPTIEVQEERSTLETDSLEVQGDVPTIEAQEERSTLETDSIEA